VAAELEELAEEHGGEEGVLKDVSSKSDAEEAYTQSIIPIWNEEDKQICGEYNALVESADESAVRLKELGDQHYLSALKNSKGKLTLKAIKTRHEKQPDLIAGIVADFAVQRDQAEEHRREYRFEEAISIGRSLASVEDERIAEHVQWATEFVTSTEAEWERERESAAAHFKDARTHREVFDYPSAIHALQSVPEAMRTSEMSGYLSGHCSLAVGIAT